MTEATQTIVERLDEAGRTGLDMSPGDPLAREAKAEIERLQARVKELEAQQAALSDPVVVHANMLRGTIAKPPLSSFLHAMGGQILNAFNETVVIAARNERNVSVDLARAVLQSSGMETTMSKIPVKIKQPEAPAEEVAIEVIAEAIVSISEGIKRMRSGRLNDKALLLLIQNAAPNVDNSKIGMREIKAVLEGIESLSATYLQKPK